MLKQLEQGRVISHLEWKKHTIKIMGDWQSRNLKRKTNVLSFHLFQTGTGASVQELPSSSPLKLPSWDAVSVSCCFNFMAASPGFAVFHGPSWYKIVLSTCLCIVYHLYTHSWILLLARFNLFLSKMKRNIILARLSPHSCINGKKTSWFPKSFQPGAMVPHDSAFLGSKGAFLVQVSLCSPTSHNLLPLSRGCFPKNVSRQV